jgi:CheY-like chemotaxis protein
MKDANASIVLVVEDNVFLREDIAHEFMEEGWAVLEAATGAGALKWLQETESVDLLVTDIGLTDAITGWEVAEAARELHPTIRVIYASGNPSNDSRHVPDSIFLNKPVSARELALISRRHL